MITRKRYTPPPAPFKPGDRVKYKRTRYKVLASTHTHSQLKGIDKAIANWQLVPIQSRTWRLQSPLTHLSEG